MHTLLKTSLILGVTAMSVNAAAVLITPTGEINVSGVSEFFPAINMVNDSGLSGAATLANYAGITHAGAGAGNAWTTGTPNGAGDYFLASSPGTPGIFDLSLGGTYFLTDLVFWGYHFGAPNGNEVREFTLGFSTDGGATFPASAVVGNPLSTFAVDAANTLDLGGTFQADTVRVNFTDNHFGGTATGGDRLGVGEIKFIGDTVPEPGAALLAVLGSFGLVLRRRPA